MTNSQRIVMSRDEWQREIRRLNRRPSAILNRLRWHPLILRAICRVRGHDWKDEQVTYDLGYTYCRRCRLGEH